MKTSTPTAPKPSDPLKILLMGPPGARKTTLMLQFPGLHVLNCDNNLDGPLRWLKDHNLEPSFTYDDIRKNDSGLILDSSECYDRVIDKLTLFQHDAEYKKRSIVGVDSLSHVNEFIIRKILKSKGKSSMEPNHWTDFKSYAYALLASKLEQTNKTVLCICHETKVTEVTGIMQETIRSFEPFFQSKIGEMIGAFFTDVWRCETRPAPGRIDTWLQLDRMPKCDHLKNSIGAPPELRITEGFKVLEPYLKGRI